MRIYLKEDMIYPMYPMSSEKPIPKQLIVSEMNRLHDIIEQHE